MNINSVERRGACVHQQASSALSLLEKYSKHESAFLALDHLLMKLKETCEAARLSGHVTKPKATPLQMVSSVSQKLQ